MCLNLKIEEQFINLSKSEIVNKKINIAKKNIIVYKALNIVKVEKKWYQFWKKDVYYSPYRKCEYSLNKKYKIDINKIIYNLKIRHYNYNSYMEINQGLHSCKTTLSAFSHCNGISDVFECIIPKGAKYFHNNHDYVSNELIVKKPLNIK